MNWVRTRRLWRMPPLLLSLFLLAGCKEPLYSNLSVVEANEMVAVLQAVGIGVSRTAEKDGLYSVNVSAGNVGAAYVVLKNEGLPRDKFSSIGEVFETKNIVGTPFEERARYAYALSQELSQTITEIAHVASARVHVVLPDPPRFNQASDGASASVVVHHGPDFTPDENASTIKSMLVYAVPDLSYDRISLSFFPKDELTVAVHVPEGPVAAANAASSITFREILGPNSRALPWIIANGVVLLILAVVILRLLGVLGRRKAP